MLVERRDMLGSRSSSDWVSLPDRGNWNINFVNEPHSTSKAYLTSFCLKSSIKKKMSICQKKNSLCVCLLSDTFSSVKNGLDLRAELKGRSVVILLAIFWEREEREKMRKKRKKEKRWEEIKGENWKRKKRIGYVFTRQIELGDSEPLKFVYHNLDFWVVNIAIYFQKEQEKAINDKRGFFKKSSSSWMKSRSI